MLLWTFFAISSASYNLPLVSKNLAHPSFQNKSEDSSPFETDQIVLITEIYLGNPPKSFHLILDISKTYSWVEEKFCTSCEQFANQYDPLESFTFTDLKINQSNYFPYVQSSLSCYFQGSLISDFLSVNSHDSFRYLFTMVNSEVSCSFIPSDGVLSFSSSTVLPKKPLVQVMKEANLISTALFSIFVQDFTIEKNGGLESNLEIGGYDLEKYSSKPEELFYMTYYKSEAGWQTKFDLVSFGLWKSIFCAQIELSTTLRYVLGDVNAFIGLLPYLATMGLDCEAKHKDYVIRCYENQDVELPSLKFYYEDNVIEIPSSAIWKCKNGLCTLLVQFKLGGYWKLGQVFLAKYYTIYNYENFTIGFAPAAGGLIQNLSVESEV